MLQCFDLIFVLLFMFYWYEGDLAVLEVFFLVMEKVLGMCLNLWGCEGCWFYGEVVGCGVLLWSFIDVLVMFYMFDWRVVGFDFLGVLGLGDDFVWRELVKWCELILLSQWEFELILIDLFCWFEVEVLLIECLVFVYGVYCIGNVFVYDDWVVAVFDWEL